MELVETAPAAPKGKMSFQDVQWLKLCAAQINSAFVLKVMCQFEEAAQLAEKGAKLLDKHYSQHKQQTAEAFELLGEILLLKGDIDEADQAVQRSLTIKKSFLTNISGNQDLTPTLATPYNLAGRVCEKRADFEKAMENYVKAFENGFSPADKKTQPPKSPPPAVYWNLFFLNLFESFALLNPFGILL